VTTVGGADGRACAPIARRPPSRSWGTWFERTLGFVYAIVVVNNIVISTDFITSTVAATSTAGAVAVLVGTGALLWSAVMVAFGRRSPWVVYPTVTILLGAQFVVLAAVTDPGRMPAVWWAWQLMVPVFVLSVGLLPARSATWVVAVAGAGYLAVRTAPASGASGGWHTSASELSLALVFVALTVVFVPAWRRTAAIADEAAGTRQRAFAEAEAARAVDRQERAASRLLHDEVIHALRAVALPAGAIEESRVRPMLAHAADLLGSAAIAPAPRGDLPGELRTLADRPGLPVTLRLTGSGRLPDRVVDALAGATGEALRNAELHADGDVIVVDATIDDDGAEIRVIDDGRGFDPATVPSGPLGFRQSILARVTEVGGTASVVSTTGVGTTVTLSWRVPAPAGVASRRLADLAGTRNRIVLGATMPILGFVVIQAGVHHGLLSDPRPALLALAVMTVLTVTAAARVTRYPMTGRRSAILVIAAVVTALAAGLALVPGNNVALAYFGAGAGAPALALIAMFRPAWESIVGAAAATAACVVMLLRLTPDGSLLLPALPAVVSNALGVVCLLAGRLTIDHMASSIRRNEELERHAHATAAQLRVARDVLAARLGRVREWVLPFLAAVQDGRTPLNSADTRREARTLEAAVRDDIRLGAQIDDPSRDLIARTRRAGGTVEIIADSDGPPVLADGLVSRLLTAALATESPPARTVLTVSGPRSDVVSLMVSPAPVGSALTEVATDLGARILRGPDFLLARVSAAVEMSPEAGTTPPAPTKIGWAA